MKRAIYDGVLLLDESLPYEVVELPLPRDSPVAVSYTHLTLPTILRV